MSQKLLIDFEDTLSTIELPLGDNVVLFGENGTGKTRVLKTINSIIELSKVNSDVKLRNILKDLNIKNFKIFQKKQFNKKKTYIFRMEPKRWNFHRLAGSAARH